jgi:hypothetical protein
MTLSNIIISSLPLLTVGFTKFPDTNGQRHCNLEFAVTDKETVNPEIHADFASNDLKDVKNLQGLVLSRRDPDTLYTVDKTNIRPRVFAIDKAKGTLKSTFLIYDLFSQNFPDIGEWGIWTDLTIAACPGDYQKDCIFILDGGNPFVRRGLNEDEILSGGIPREYPQSIIYFEEPKIISTSIQVAGKRIPFTFPGNRAFDVEAITSKDGTIMVITKNTMDYGDISLDKKINKENVAEWDKARKKEAARKKAAKKEKEAEKKKAEKKKNDTEKKEYDDKKEEDDVDESDETSTVAKDDDETDESTTSYPSSSEEEDTTTTTPTPTSTTLASTEIGDAETSTSNGRRQLQDNEDDEIIDTIPLANNNDDDEEDLLFDDNIEIDDGIISTIEDDDENNDTTRPVDEIFETKEENLKKNGKLKKKLPTSRENDKKDLGYYAVHIYSFPLLGKKHDKSSNQKKAVVLEENAVLTNIEDGEVTGAASADSGLLLFTTTGIRFYRWDKMCDDSESGKWWSDRKNPCYAPVYKQAYEKINLTGHGLAYDPLNMKAYTLIKMDGQKSLRSFNLRMPQRYTKFALSKQCIKGNPQNPLKNQINGKEKYSIGKKIINSKR